MANKRILRLLKIFTGVQAGGKREYFQLDGRLEQIAHFLMLVYESFSRNRCFARASALSYSTLLAIIPLLAVALSFTSIFLKDQDDAKLNQGIERFVAIVMPSTMTTNPPAGQTAPVTNVIAGTVGTNALAALFSVTANPSGTTTISSTTNVSTTKAGSTVSAQKEIAQQIESFVKNSSSRALGVTGMIFFVVTSISLLRAIEETFNDLWGVTQCRNWLIQIVLYSAVITWGPVLLVLVLGLTGGSYFQETRGWLEGVPLLAPIYSQVLPIALISLALTLFYKLTPNTKVNFKAALLGGFFAGTAWHFYNKLGFLLATRANSASKIYGSLALLVLLMGGLYIVWLILLLGAQIAYAFQNRIAYLQDKLAENVNQRGREFVALRLMTLIGQRFQGGVRPATSLEISDELCLPSRLVQQILRTLLDAQLVVEVNGAEAAYVPARPLEAINAWQILLALRTTGGQEISLDDETTRRVVYGEFARIENAERQAASSVTLISLLNQPPVPTLAAPVPDAVEPGPTVETPPANTARPGD